MYRVLLTILELLKKWEASMICQSKSFEMHNIMSVCTKLIYLASVVSRDEVSDLDVLTRINEAKGAFVQLQPVRHAKSVILHIKLTTFL